MESNLMTVQPIAACAIGNARPVRFWVLQVFCNLVMHRSRERGGDKICKVEHQSIPLSMQRKNGIERLSRCLDRSGCTRNRLPSPRWAMYGGSRANKSGASKGHFINDVHTDGAYYLESNYKEVRRFHTAHLSVKWGKNIPKHSIADIIYEWSQRKVACI